MSTKIFAFLGGAVLGAVCMAGVFHVIGDLQRNWGMVCLVSIGSGLLAAVLGKRFWEFVLTIWP